MSNFDTISKLFHGHRGRLVCGYDCPCLRYGRGQSCQCNRFKKEIFSIGIGLDRVPPCLFCQLIRDGVWLERLLPIIETSHEQNLRVLAYRVKHDS